MKSTLKIIVFAIVYGVAFYFFRNSEFYNYRLLAADIGSLPWLYSTIGSIFGIISAFIIQKEWQRWNDLVDSVKGEVSALSELWLWSSRLSDSNRLQIHNSIKQYLKVIVNEGWQKTEKGEVSDELEEAITEMNNVVSDINDSNPILSTIAFSLFGNVMNYREKRLRFGSSQMPRVLLNTFRFATFLMIFLCPLIAVKDHALHLLFSISISALSFIIYTVSLDMDHPLRPGGWHLTTSDYSNLLKKLESKN